MKKSNALKTIGIIALIVLSVAVSICLFVIPVETKAFFSAVWDILNQPLPIVGVSVLIIAITIIKLISMTSWGKKKLAKLEEAWGKWKKEVDEEKSHEEELVKENEEHKRATELMLSDFGADIDGLIKVLYEALKTSPNKKVNAIASKLGELYPLTLEEAKKQAEKELEEAESKHNIQEPRLENMGLDDKAETESVQNG